MEEKKEKIDSKNNQEEWDNHIFRIAMRMSEQTSLSLHLPTRIESPKGTPMGKFWQAINKAGGSVLVRRNEHLLDIAVKHLKVVNLLLKLTRSSTKCLSIPIETTMTHRIISESEETVHWTVSHQTQQLYQVKLHLSLCNGVLRIDADFPTLILTAAHLSGIQFRSC